MRVTKKQIHNSILKKTGWDVHVFGDNGCFHFYSDEEITGLKLANFFSTTVYVYALNHLTLEQWVEEFEYMLERYNNEI